MLETANAPMKTVICGNIRTHRLTLYCIMSGLLNLSFSHDTFTVCRGGYTIEHSGNISLFVTNENTLV